MSFHLPGITTWMTNKGVLNVERLWLMEIDYWIHSHPSHIPVHLMPTSFVDTGTFLVEVPETVMIECAACKNALRFIEARMIRSGGTPVIHTVSKDRLKPQHVGLICQHCCRLRILQTQSMTDVEFTIVGPGLHVNVRNVRINLLLSQVVDKWKRVTLRGKRIRCAELLARILPRRLPTLGNDLLTSIASLAIPEYQERSRVIWAWDDCTDYETYEDVEPVQKQALDLAAHAESNWYGLDSKNPIQAALYLQLL